MQSRAENTKSTVVVAAEYPFLGGWAKTPILGAYSALFASADSATVLLVMLVATLVSRSVYGTLVGRRAHLAMLTAFGLLGRSGAYHVIEPWLAGRYTPGTATALPYLGVGAVVCAAALRAWSGPLTRHAAHQCAPLSFRAVHAHHGT